MRLQEGCDIVRAQMSDSRLLYTPRPQEMSKLDGQEIRSTFLVDRVFSESTPSFTFTDLDRLALCGVRPSGVITLANDRQTGSDFFLQRRELGIINIGNTGTVRVDGKEYSLSNLDCLYVSMGAKEV